MSTPNEAISILVVDDDETCLSVVSATLKKWNYEVVTAKHPFEALCTLRIKQGAFDLVVSDVHMPDINGIGLREIIKRDYNVPVVLMSVDEGILATKGMDNGSAYCIKKPVRPNDLRDLWKFADTRKRRNELKLVTKPYSSKKAPKDKGGEGTSYSINKAKVIWTNDLHQRFLQAIDRIGFHEAVPRKILETMKVPGLTKAHVASHLQKYRLFLKRSLSENTSDCNDNNQSKSDHCSSIDKNLLGSQSLLGNPSNQHQNSGEQSFHRSFLQHSSSVNTSFSRQETLSSTYLGTRSQSLLQNNYPTNLPSLLSHQVEAPQYPNNEISTFDTSIFCMRGQNSDQNETYKNIGTSNISSTSKSLEPTNINYDCYKSPDIGGIVQSSAKNDIPDLLDDDIIPWSSILDDDDRVQLSNLFSDEQIQGTSANFLPSAPPSNLFSDEQIRETSASFLPSAPPLLNNTVENEVQMMSIQTSLNTGGSVSSLFLDQANVYQPQLQQIGGENLMNIFSWGMNEWQETLQVPRSEQTSSQNKGVGINLVDHYQQGGTSVEPSNIHPSLEALEDVEFLELLKTFRDCEQDMSLPL